MDINALTLALRVADLGSFSAVARETEMNPSSISRAVAAVEDRLGIRLFQRTSRTLSLTAEGEAYLLRVAPLVDQLEDARRSAQSTRARPVGHLRITASVAYGTVRLIPLLSSLRAAAPDLEVELILSDATLDMVAERIDLAVRLAPAPEGELISSRLHGTRYRVVATPDWIAQNGMPSGPSDLGAMACLRGTLPGHRDAWTFRRDPDGHTRTVPIRGPVLISNPLALRDAAKEGLGPALLADWLIAQDLRDGTLVDVLPGHDATATTFDTAAWLLYPSRTYLPAKVRVAIDILRTASRGERAARR
ncbi:LysR family transcriptional regulator [Jannaschia pagri]|uniref:LysR family transcriptional regulator n=1 Tax=Jannaschia pagri TaxID=2829797 RepID=A0ABQ4NJ72_9RHOB|nr:MULTISPECIES: LysR family transcriptional regulator [unclassified Jannaschia]GIT89633.1 LysR family transcriptional regulator [Jannaschia sp. AI_61]GIT94259.1 LysR family transcriptional regulator [Jannaschia sp. AI_62]